VGAGAVVAPLFVRFHAGSRPALGVGKNLQALNYLRYSIWLCSAEITIAARTSRIGFDLPNSYTHANPLV